MSPSTTKLWHLEQINLLQGLGPEVLAQVDQRSHWREAKKNQVIYFPEEPSSVVFFLKAGRVKIGSYSDDGKEIIKAIIHPGEIFGELGVVGETERQDFAIAMDNATRMCAMNVSDIQQMMTSNPHLAMAVTRTIGEKLMTVERKLTSLVFADAPARIIGFIKDMALKHGTPVGDEILLKHNLTHQDIAQLTASSRQTVTTVLNQLRAEDKIYFERNRMLIRDMEKL